MVQLHVFQYHSEFGGGGGGRGGAGEVCVCGWGVGGYILYNSLY